MAKSGRYFGLDLAWSATNATGACALDANGTVIDERLLGSDDEIIDWISNSLDRTGVIAIDAPLLVPNASGRRPCESAVSRAYGSRKAGPHSSNRTRLIGLHGVIRGEGLVGRLATFGFGDPWERSDRTVLEVYPHPTLVEAFGLAERLIYKAKRGVGVAERRHGLRCLDSMLQQLSGADPPLLGPRVEVLDGTRGKALKAVEDRLDARVCAWVASVWANHPQRVRLFGDNASGHIAIPTGRFVGTS